MKVLFDKLKGFKQSGLILLLLGIFSSLNGQDTTSAINNFDFYIGKWDVQNQRKMDDGKWIEFTATVESRKILNGYGNVDFFNAKIAGKPFEGMTIRQFDTATNTWQIRWFDSDDPTAQPEPSVGKFRDGEGTFYKTIEIDNGRKVKIRFYWYDINENSFKWESGWSLDGINWNPTWKMIFNRKG